MRRKNPSHIINYFWQRRRELLDTAFWVHVGRAAKERLVRPVSSTQFHATLRALERRPWSLRLEVTNICNANCIFCAYQYQTRTEMVMDERVFQKALNDYCAIGGGDLAFQVTVGDPLVDKEFVKRVREARRRPQIRDISTVTNGILLYKHGISEVLTSGLNSIFISLAGFDEEMYRTVYRNDNYAKMRDNVYALLKANSEMGNLVKITLGFRTTLSISETLSLPDYQPMKRFPHEASCQTYYGSWGNSIRQQDLLGVMRLMPPLSKVDKEPCHWLYQGPVIYSDGRVGLCGCQDYNVASELVVGHIMEESLESIWQSQRVRKLRERFRESNLPDICSTCTMYQNLDLYRNRRGSERGKLIEHIYPAGGIPE